MFVTANLDFFFISNFVPFEVSADLDVSTHDSYTDEFKVTLLIYK